MHKTGNVLNYLPKSSQPKAKQGLHEIWMAETRAQAEHAFDDWIERYDDKYPKATACLTRHRRELLAFYDFLGVHWTHLRTTNVIESSFATIRHRSKRAKGCMTRQSMLSMIYKIGMYAEKSWRRLRGFRQLAKVIEGVEIQRRHRGRRGQQSRRMRNPPYTRFDYSSYDQWVELFRELGNPVYRHDFTTIFWLRREWTGPRPIFSTPTKQP